jgi:MSHA type pilus biogenesis protein MshL
MAYGRLKGFCLIVLLSLFAGGCSSLDIKREVVIPEQSKEVIAERPAAPQPATPDFVSVSEDVSPLKTRNVTIVARNTPLRDVLHVIAEATSLNLIMESGVNPDIPITLTLKNVSAYDALSNIFSSADYFYTVRQNMLTVKAVDTKVIELGHPAVIQNYSVDVGGDILGGATGSTSGGSKGATSSGIKGSITQNSKSDETAFKFWDSIEKALGNILGVSPTGGTGQVNAGTVPQSFTVNRLTGTLSITATKKNLERVEQFIGVVQKVINRQVMVEARIIEVTLSDDFQFGIDWTTLFNNATLFHNKLGSVSVGTNNFASVINSTSPYFQVGVTASQFTSTLRALQTQGEVRVLSNPRVNIMNGQTALLSVGREVSFVSRVESQTTASSGAIPTTTFTVDTSSILSGIIIGIVPHINEFGEIALSITPIISDLVQLQDKTIGQVGDNQIQISLPTVDLRELSTTVKVRDGQMIIIGGLISKKENLTDNQVPLAGNIPIIGTLFKSRDKKESRSELVVLLRPVLVSH